jgi:hypothetical protein
MADLRSKDSALLAVHCKEVSEDPSMDAAIAEQARQLKHQWLLLEMRGQPHHYKENDRLNAEKQAHKERMADFLERYALVK